MEKKNLFLLRLVSIIHITNYFNYELRFNSNFSRNSLSRLKDEAYMINLDDKKVKEHIGFHYLLREIHLYRSILWQLNIFPKKY